MKILHIIPSLAKGGAERIVLDICNELQNSGEEVKLVTFSNQNDYSFLTQNLQHTVIPSKVTPSILGKTELDISLLQTFIDEFQPDIIHAHLFESVMVVSQIDYFRSTYFLHFHDNMKQFRKLFFDFSFSKEKITNWFEKKLVLKSFKKKRLHLIGISSDTIDYIKSNLPSKIPKSLLFNCIDKERFTKIELDKPKTFRIVTIGSLVDNKSHDLAIQILKKIHSKGHLITLDILGNGPNLEKLKSLTNELQLSDFVTFHGNVDYPENSLSKASLYLHTAKREAFGLVMIEAMAAGLPVVCTDAYGNRDLIVEGKNGHLISERNPEIIADCILKLMDNPTKLKDMGIFAKNFSAKYDVKEYIENLKQLYVKSTKLLI